jgi:hypothetical protein
MSRKVFVANPAEHLSRITSPALHLTHIFVYRRPRLPTYTEPLAKTYPLVGVINPGAYSNSTYFTSPPVDFGQFSQLLATVMTGNAIPSSSEIVALLQYSSASNGTFSTLDSIAASLQFGSQTTGSPTLLGTQKSLELRNESLGTLPVGAARFWRLAVTISSSSSEDTTEFAAALTGGNWRYPANNFFGPDGQSGFLSSSLSNVIYSTAIPVVNAQGKTQPGQIPVN